MSKKFVQTPAVALYVGISAVSTTARLTPYPVDLDGVKLVIGDFGTIGYITIDPKISGYEEVCSFTGITDNGDNTATLTGLTRNLSSKSPYASGTGKIHGASAAVVFSDAAPFLGALAFKDNDETITGQWNFSQTPITPPAISDSSTTVKGVTKLSVAPAVAANPIAVGANDPKVPTADPTTLFAPLSSVLPSGFISPYAGRSAPTGWLLCDGTAVSRSTYAALLAIICPSQTATMTIASPAVVTAVVHGLVAGDKFHFTTTGGFPSGVSANTDYYVLSTSLTTDTFKFALSLGGAAVITTGSQSGTHTVYKSAFGKGDGSTTFNVPDLRSKAPIGLAATAPTMTLSFEPAAVSAGSDNVTIVDTVFPSQGQKVQLTSTGTLPAGLSLATDYWIARTSSTTIQFCSSQANANTDVPLTGAATPINITDQGTGIHTIVYTDRAHTVIGTVGGENTHGIAAGEHANHVHASINGGGAAAGGWNAAAASSALAAQTGLQGLDRQHNNMQPFAVVNYVIKT